MRLVIGAALVAATLAACGTPAAPLALGDATGRPPFENLGTLAGKGYQAYRGIQHTHVGENGDDGQGTLAEAYAYGQAKARLDFMAVSSHAHMIDDGGYEALKRAAARFSRSGSFLALVAQEWSSISKGGHVNILEAGTRCDVPNGDWPTLYNRWLPAHTEVGFVQFNHPHPDNPREFGGAAFSPLAASLDARVARSRVVAMALLNGPGKYSGDDMRGRPDPYDMGKNGQNFEAEYVAFLNRGWRIGAVADADNHTPNWGMASPARTGVWAKSLTKRDIVAAFRSRRTFAAWDHNVSLWFQAGGQPMGSVLDAAGDLALEIVASDPDSDIERLELFADTDGNGRRAAEIVARKPVGGRSARWAFTVPAPQLESYYFAKIVFRESGAWAWSSPVWVRPRGVSGAALPAFATEGDVWPDFSDAPSPVL